MLEPASGGTKMNVVPKTHITRSRLKITLTASAAAVVIAGCGGGGSSSGVGPQTRLNGALTPNVIFYANSPDNGNTIGMNMINPDGSGKTSLGTLPPGFQGIAMNPAVLGQKVFGYSPGNSTSATYGIFSNNRISSVGATQIVKPTYSFIESMQVSLDGAWVYYVASIGANYPALYKVSITGGTPITLDNTGFIMSANVDTVTGTMVTYDKEIVLGNGNNVSAVYVLSTKGGVPTLVTNDQANNYEMPQFSKDASQIVLESDKDHSNFEVYTMSASNISVNGSGLTQVTDSPNVAKQDGVSFSADGTTTSYVGQGLGAANTGIYVSGLIGANPPAPSTLVVQDSTVQAGMYWTSFGGRSTSGLTAYLARPRRHGLIP